LRLPLERLLLLPSDAAPQGLDDRYLR
jgi:hypothetical protein